MGWFSKKEEIEKSDKVELPPLPKLPKLPELPKLESFDNSILQLPALPKNSLGESRGGGVFDKTKFEKEEIRFQKPLKKITDEMPLKKFPVSEKIKEPIKEISPKVKESGPVFIRLDKFEESVKLFEKAREKITEVEKILNNTKRIKEEEEEELDAWEKEINIIKEQLENIDKNIFSKVE